MLISDMQAEYEKGNYCIAGGDFNKDLLGDSGKIFGIDGADYTWAQPVDSKLLLLTMKKIRFPRAEMPTVRITTSSLYLLLTDL